MTAQSADSTSNPNPPRVRRARKRLHALGIDVDALDQEQVHTAWEQRRAAYIQAAEDGRHFDPVHAEGDPLPGACLHARLGFLRDAIRDLYGAHPDGWSPAHITWPTPEERRRGARGR